MAVFGLARSGLAALGALKSAGADVVAWDDSSKAREKAGKLGARLEVLAQKNLKECAFLVLAPGVPLHFPEPHPVVQAARTAGTEIICDMELFHRLGHRRRTVGITGTNGKSTTTALVQHILKSSGYAAVMGGNIGLPVFDLPMPPENGVFVFELSSYQLDLCPTYRPDIAILLNITPDHLDRHGTMEKYAAVKEKIFEGPGVAVIGTDDDYCRAAYERVKKAGQRKTISFSVRDGSLKEAMKESSLKGEHNYQNALAAAAVCREMGVAEDKICAGLRSFAGLPHRQFPVRAIGGVVYINDSKATNAESASKALLSYENIYWIAGGRPKEGGLAGLESLAEKVRKGFLIGEATEEFALWMEANRVPYEKSGTLAVAVTQAHDAAQKRKSGVVLLSPACASFDQFSSYEERGDVFTRLVNEIPGA